MFDIFSSTGPVLQRSTAKRVVVYRFDREPVLGFADAFGYLKPDGVEVLLPNGFLQRIPYSEAKQVSFVKELDTGRGRPEQKTFQSRPKVEGLWVEMEFRDGDVLEGVMPNNLTATDPAGFMVTPPNATGNTQRIFVPRAALRALTVKAVIGLRAGRKPKETGTAAAQQRLFPDDSPATPEL